MTDPTGQTARATGCPNCGQRWRGYAEDLPGVRVSACCGQPQSVLLAAAPLTSRSSAHES